MRQFAALPLLGLLACGAAPAEVALEQSEAPLDDASTSCAARGSVVIWNGRDPKPLAAALAEHASPCLDYYVSIPPVGLAADSSEKLDPRGPALPEHVRGLGPRFHALAEFHWASWSRWVGGGGPSRWKAAGVEFRRRMEAAGSGYDTAAGDSWDVNELPSSVRRGQSGDRENARALVEGLYQGPPGAAPLPGVVFVTGLSSDTGLQGNEADVTEATTGYKRVTERFLEDAPFWRSMDEHVLFWAQESYASPAQACVAGDEIAALSSRLNHFAQAPAWLAEAGPPQTEAAQRFFARAYLPVLNATWQLRASQGYGDTWQMPLSEMEKFVSLEVYAVRAWSRTHAAPGDRIGFGFDPPDAAELAGGVDEATFTAGQEAVSGRLATALQNAYRDSPRFACSPSGNYGGCGCAVTGAKLNPTWDAFGSWRY